MTSSPRDTWSDGYSIRPLGAQDAPALAAAYTRNREHLAPYEPERSPGFFTERGQQVNVEPQLRSMAAATLDVFVILHEEEIVGRVALNNIVRGVLQSGSLGYWVDHEHLGLGLATRAVEHVVRRAGCIGLHRLEAGTLLDNHRSQAVLERTGFTRYGVAAAFLFIGGRWSDHVLYQRVLHDHSPDRIPG